MKVKIIRIWYIALLVWGGLTSSLSASFVSLQNPSISPKPLPSVENNGEGVVSFGLVETSDEEAPAVDAFKEPNIRISVELNKLILKNDDVSAIGGKMMEYFSATYNAEKKRIIFTQIKAFPNFGSASVSIPVEVTANAKPTDNSLNGFNANISANDESTTADGNAAEFTYTEDTLVVGVDSDGDNVPDTDDIDDDNDSILDRIEASTATNNGDTDGDNIPDSLDTDSDNDGILDNVEAQTFKDFIRAESTVDSRGLNTAYPKGLTPIDTDSDGTPNYQDTDSDNDDILDEVEGEIDSDGDSKPNYVDLDSDNDSDWDKDEGTGDRDNDGIANYIDPNDHDDSDGDNIPDATDVDDDNDGILDVYEERGATNNGDTDGDNVPDTLDTDSDNDGILDNVEAQASDAYIAPSGVVDRDGLDTSYGVGLMPVNTDNEDQADYQDTDSDNDGIPDDIEGSKDSDKDGIANYRDTDSDDDDILDATEGVIDTDKDGQPNYIDTDSDNDGLLDKDEGEVDANNNGVPDYIDKGSVVVTPQSFNAKDDKLVVTHYGKNVGYLSTNDTISTSYTLWELIDLPLHGEVDLNPDSGKFTYSPEANYNGPDNFSYRLRNSEGQSDTARVHIDVNCAASQTSDNGDSVSFMTMLITWILTTLVGLYFIRKEEQGEAL